jgi:hypothetical protein
MRIRLYADNDWIAYTPDHFANLARAYFDVLLEVTTIEIEALSGQVWTFKR